MRRTRDIRAERLTGFAVLTLLLVMMGLLLNPFSFISHAQSQGKVVVRSAKIRKDADVNSEPVGSAQQGASVTINNEVTAADGTVWYQVFVDANTMGYIRSDLVEKTDGSSAGATGGSTGGSTAPVTMNPTVEVTAVQPQSATVTGGQVVRVRSDASTSSQIVTTVQNGVVITVNGQATGSDGKVWYQVSFVADGAEVAGFIRSDYASLAGELVPVTAETPVEGENGGEVQQPEEVVQEPVVELKDYDTELDGQDGNWYLIDRQANGRYNISELFQSMQQNAENYTKTLKEVKNQKIIIIVLLILLVVAILAATLLFMKVREVMDEAYFAAVEKETLRERNAAKPKGTSRKVVHKMGEEPQSAPKPRTAGGKGQAAQGRPAAQGNAGAQERAAAQRNAGVHGQGRPAAQGNTVAQGRPVAQGNAAAQGRPAAQGNVGAQGRAVAQRNAGVHGQGRPAAQGSAGMQGRTAGQQSRGAEASQRLSEDSQLERAGQNTQEGMASRNARQGMTQEGAVQPRKPVQPKQAEQNPAWKSKNFMNEEDDEFEFEFLNWDGDDQ